MSQHRLSSLVAAGLAAFSLGAGAPGAAHAAQGSSISIVWWKGKPSEYLAQLSRSFTEETGIAVHVTQIPWAQYSDRIQREIWPQKDAEFDIIIGDSQWLGRGAAQGHYVDLTEWSQKNVPWSDIVDSARRFYCEYQGRIYAVPCVGDALGFSYRKDLFESAAEKSAFRQKYGYDLMPPRTWSQFRDVAEHFTRRDQGLYGAALYYAGPPAYDDVTQGVRSDPVVFRRRAV